MVFSPALGTGVHRWVEKAQKFPSGPEIYTVQLDPDMSSGLIVGPSSSLPSIFTRGRRRGRGCSIFFVVHPQSHTRRAYREAVGEFSGFYAEHGIVDLAQVEPVHVAEFVEAQLQQYSRFTVKQRLARCACSLTGGWSA